MAFFNIFVFLTNKYALLKNVKFLIVEFEHYLLSWQK